MPSRAERRRLLERVCRAGAVGALATLLVLPPDSGETRRMTTRTAELAQTLRSATTEPVASLRADLDEVPDAETRSWLRAMRGAGTHIEWHQRTPLPASVVSVEPVTDPLRPRRITLAGLPGGSTTIGDALGVIDSTHLASAGSREVEARTAGAVTVRVPRAMPRAADRDSLELRRVLVLGRAGWEARFTAAALEEAGWTVETEFVVTPPNAGGAISASGHGVAVRTPGARAPIDTARYAAVVALDDAAGPRAAAIARFVASGGGLVMGDGVSRALLALSPARQGAALRPVPGGVMSAEPRRGLNGRGLTEIRSDAVVLERQGAIATIAARRHETGRVLRTSFEDTWRWRMEGGESAPADHREWWSRLVGSVAYAPVVTDTVPVGASDQAPLAALHAALGPPGSIRSSPVPTQVPWNSLLFALFILLAMTEWTSRRLRGAP